MALTIVRKIKQEKADEHQKIDVNIGLMYLPKCRQTH